ncbi:angiopoietin-1 receptor-like isoform X3 [Paramuricea clavata]|uniref:Angiopoietin-1 receptor-like isoform X3 n=1 Tax=Paramuricea clavata TaxID=317549 RepID=A0A7D9DQH9_PARCT|nr:angiopoietin-1 receptor-like isoform X3 [Paramuricea clavata]
MPCVLSFIISADINECESPSLYSCSTGFDCANTIGSYTCVCEGRIRNSDGACIKGFKRHRVNMRLNEVYTSALGNKNSQEFIDFEKKITAAMVKIYANNDNYFGVEVERLTNGSVIADLGITFTDTDTTGISDLLVAVRNNSFGDFKVDPDAVTVVITGACPSDECPGNSTCKQLTSDTISCPCNKRYYYDGVTCIEFIVIVVELSLENTFTEELKNTSSPVYQELERNVTAELTEIFKDTPNFKEIVILGFRNGSTIVDFEIKYRDDPGENKKTVVAETVKEKIIKTGNLGNFKLKSVQIQGTPPEPTNFTHTDVTQTRIDLSWNKPIGHEFFVINGYIVSHKTTPETQFKTQKITSGELNVVLSDLQGDTFYVITVHGYNDEGDGDKLRIEVTTKDSPSSSNLVIIIAAIIVVVLLFIICLVVFFQLRKRRHHKQSRQRAYAQPRFGMNLTRLPTRWTHHYNYEDGDEEASASGSKRLYRY